jgi:hypothetical protein
MIKVVRPSFFNVVKLGFVFAVSYVGGEVWSRYSRREYMRRVRERNRKKMIEAQNPKQLGDLHLMTLDGKVLTPASLSAKFPAFFFGDFKTFINLLTSFSNIPYFKEMHFVFVSDEKTIQKIQSGAIRTEIPNT